MQRNISSILIGLLSVVCFVGFLNLLMADVIDEFDSPKLNTNLWEMKQVCDASYTIDDGILKMTSPNTQSGIMLYFPINIEELDITFEVKASSSNMPLFYCGTLAQLMPPQINTEINSNWLASFFSSGTTWYVKQDPVTIGQIPPNPFTGDVGETEWLIEITYSESEGKVTFVLNGEEVGVVDKNKDVEERYFYIAPDHYDSHSEGEIEVEYVKISGPGSAILAVEPLDKLAMTWAKMKVQ